MICLDWKVRRSDRWAGEYVHQFEGPLHKKWSLPLRILLKKFLMQNFIVCVVFCQLSGKICTQIYSPLATHLIWNISLWKINAISLVQIFASFSQICEMFWTLHYWNSICLCQSFILTVPVKCFLGSWLGEQLVFRT